MGMLIEGDWIDNDEQYRTGDKGTFVRENSVFRDTIKADGSTEYPAEKGRYHLFLRLIVPGHTAPKLFAD